MCHYIFNQPILILLSLSVQSGSQSCFYHSSVEPWGLDMHVDRTLIFRVCSPLLLNSQLCRPDLLTHSHFGLNCHKVVL